MDSGVKLLVILILGVIPFFIDSSVNFTLLVAYLVFATFLSGIQLPIILKNILGYIIIIILPYAFGLLMAIGVSKITGQEPMLFYSSLEDVALRLFQLFILWYVGILYFNTTKPENFLGLFDKLLSPLKRIGVPVSDFLLVIMCVINHLKELAPEVKESFAHDISQIFGKKRNISKRKMEGVSKMLVVFIVNSFQRLGNLEEYIKQVENKDLFNYQFNLNKLDILAIFSIVILLGSMLFLSSTAL